MQIIFEDENEGEYSRRTGAVGVVICAKRVSGCVERKHNGRNGGRRSRV